MNDIPSYQGSMGPQSMGERAEHPEWGTTRAAREFQRGARRLGDSVVRALERGRTFAAAGLSKAADTLRSSSNGNASARRFAESLEQGASYLRRTDLSGMQRDMADLVKQYPFQALGAAFVVGLVLGRRLSRR